MSRRGSSGVMPKARPLPAHVRDTAKPHLIYYCYQQDCGIGEAATDYQRLLRDLGWDVEVRPWRRDYDDLYRDAEAVKIHHWHPQPEDPELIKGRRMPGYSCLCCWALRQ